jgi:hypothetical protein
VLFVGAGASVNPPSNLPLFKKLAQQIGVFAREPYQEGDPIDRFLGELSDGFDVHDQVRQLIDDASSEPNDTHRAIVQLAAASTQSRIITTNFDVHLSGAADELGLSLGDTFHGPALPVGRTFTGLAHLHGSVKRAAEQLVLTDHDFGRAYLTDAWATRFLREVFEHFVVLFVGFSHDDPIINYLGLGLPSGTRRYILTSKPDDPRMRRLRITPIGYPATDGHPALTHALSEWAKRASMSALDHRARVRDVIEGGPPKNPVDADYLRQRLETPEGAFDFSGYARDPGWLRWLEDQEVFLSNFAAEPTYLSDDPRLQASRRLGIWFVERFIEDTTYQGAGLQLLQRRGQRMSDYLFQMASGALSHADIDAGARRRWLTLLATSIHGQTASPSLDSQFSRQTPPNDPANLALLRQALRPRLKLGPDYASIFASDDEPDRPPSADLDWPVSHRVVKDYWKALKEAGVPVDYRSGTVFESALLSAYELLAAWDSSDRTFDRTSFRRSAIEPHAQDRFRDVVDIVIDGLRDYGEAAVATDPALIRRWWDLEHRLFRRLAVHVVGTAHHFDASGRLQWLLDQDLLYDAATKHETYLVLGAALGEASPELRARVLEDANRGPDREEREHLNDRDADYMRFNLLTWLTQADPTWDEAQSALDAIQAARPEFQPRQGHLDLDHWMESGTWVDSPPESLEDFTARVQENAEAALARLLAVDYRERDFSGTTWDGALILVRSLAESDPMLGLAFWGAVDASVDERSPALRFALIDGWKSADLGENRAQISHVIGVLADGQDAAPVLSLFLRDQIRAYGSTFDGESAAQFRDIARTLWAAHRESFTHSEDFEPSSLALNTWPGELAEYWILEISRRWSDDRDNWAGLNAEERDALLALLDGPTAAADATHPAIATEVLFLHGADPDFTIEHIFPLFETPGREGLAWEPFLYHPRWNNRFLKQGFLDLVLKAAPIASSLARHGLESQYWGLLAGILLYSDIDQEQRTLILDQLVIEDEGARIVPLIDELADLLENEESGDASQHWDAWVGDYMRRRFNGHPRTPKPEELEAWADLVPVLGPRTAESIALVLTRPIALRDNFRSRDLTPELAHEFGAQIVEYLAHRVRNSATINYMAQYHLAEVTQVLIAELGSDAVTPLRNAAAEHGMVLPGKLDGD